MAKNENYRKFFLKILLYAVTGNFLVQSHNHQSVDEEPEFLAPLENLTVTQGRDVSFTCVVNHLGTYRVAWLKSDSKAILAIHTHMVALNPRLEVTHNGHNTWKLNIAHVQLNDSGSYMCQVNTDPMRSQWGHLDVVVPPDILNEPDSSGSNFDQGVANEGGQIVLVCTATGVPLPTTIWRREGAKDIAIRSDNREKKTYKHIEGERLTLNHVQRADMGGYLCIASNGVPPSVSKRYEVQVNFPPSVKAVNQLVGAPVESHVTLQCLVEVFPKPLNGWYRNDGKIKLHDGSKYHISESLLAGNAYTWQMNLTIRNLQKTDFAAYTCISVNALGKQDARVRLQEFQPPPKAATTTSSTTLATTRPTTTRTTTTTATTPAAPPPHIHTKTKQQRKQHQSHNVKTGHDTGKVKGILAPNIIPDNGNGMAAIAGVGSNEVHTPEPIRPSGSGMEKTRNTQTPADGPPHDPPYLSNTNGSAKYSSSNFPVNVTIVLACTLLLKLL